MQNFHTTLEAKKLEVYTMGYLNNMKWIQLKDVDDVVEIFQQMVLFENQEFQYVEKSMHNE